MKEERIIIEIDEEGNPTIDVEGVKGKACLVLTEQLEKALGKVSKRTEKKAMSERPVVVTVEQVQKISNR